MKSLKITAAALVLSMVTIGVNAQPNRGPQRGHGEKQTPEKIAEIQTDKLDQQLELSDAQESKIYAIYLKDATQREEKMETAKKEREERIAGEDGKKERPERGEMHEKRGDVKEKMGDRKDGQTEILKEVMAQLNDDQKIEFAIMLSRGGDKKMGRGGMQQGPRMGQGGPRGGQQMGQGGPRQGGEQMKQGAPRQGGEQMGQGGPRPGGPRQGGEQGNNGSDKE